MTEIPPLHPLLASTIGSIVFLMGEYAGEADFSASLVTRELTVPADAWHVRIKNRTTLRTADFTLTLVEGPWELEIYADLGDWSFYPGDLISDMTEAIHIAFAAFRGTMALLAIPTEAQYERASSDEEVK